MLFFFFFWENVYASRCILFGRNCWLYLLNSPKQCSVLSVVCSLNNTSNKAAKGRNINNSNGGKLTIMSQLFLFVSVLLGYFPIIKALEKEMGKNDKLIKIKGYDDNLAKRRRRRYDDKRVKKIKMTIDDSKGSVSYK